MAPADSLRQRLKAVDPNLKIIPGGTRRHSHQTTNKDWEKAAGVICENCGQEVFRSRDGLCMNCWEKANEIEVRDKAGALSFLPLSVIREIAHPAGRQE